MNDYTNQRCGKCSKGAQYVVTNLSEGNKSYYLCNYHFVIFCDFMIKPIREQLVRDGLLKEGENIN